MKLTDLIEKRIPKTIVEKWKSRHEKNNPQEPEKLTHLQETIFESSIFWDWQTAKNIIVQGQTSSGKTLIGEVATARCIAEKGRNVIYLVPFRAMVSEKWHEFEAVMGRKSAEWRIYPSSSDYQEDDSFISRGEYDLAVIVYEKLFALLAASGNQVLQNCGLIIVDECQMIGDPQRGPKLEFVLSRILADYQGDRKIRIIGLTSISTQINLVASWLDAEIIIDRSRPKQLRESICALHGKCKVKIENEDGSIAECKEEKIEFDTQPKDLDELVIELTRLHVKDSQKVLIFRSSKKITVEVAEALAKKMPPVMLTEQLKESLKEIEDDEVVNDFLTKLLPYGVAYHNASLSSELREIIEDQFKADDGAVRVVVATETLAIGVNLPADVVIVADLRKPSGGHQVDISTQEYKNYVGRAGRFGKGHLPYGQSYLLSNTVGQMDTLWERYIVSPPTDITSAFNNLTCEQQTPYILNWIGSSKRYTSPATLQQYLQKTLAFTKDRNICGSIKHQIELLEKIELIKPVVEDEIVYESPGEAVAGYALSLRTINILKRVRSFVELHKKKDFPVLDILFSICKCEEIGYLRYPVLTKQDYLLNKSLRDIFSQDGLYIIKGSELDRIRKQKYTPNEDDLLAMKRSLLLYHWRTGSAVRDIRRATKLAGFLSGDLSRLADVAAFLLEALSSLAYKFNDTQHMTSALRTFASTVHYGVPGMAVSLANKHVRGISRPMLKKLCDEFSGVGDLAVHLLLERDKFTSIPEAPRKKLIDALTRRLPKGDKIGTKDHYIIVSSWIRKNVLDESWRDIIREIYSTDSDESLYSAFAEILMIEQIKYNFFSTGREFISAEICNNNVLFLFMHNRYGNYIEVDEMTERLNSVSNKKKDKIVIVSSTGFNSDCALKAYELGLLLITSDGLIQACFRSIADANTNSPLSQFLLKCIGYVNMSNIDEKVTRFISKSNETNEEYLSMENKEYDVFRSHASIDKETHARPLV